MDPERGDTYTRLVPGKRVDWIGGGVAMISPMIARKSRRIHRQLAGASFRTLTEENHAAILAHF